MNDLISINTLKGEELNIISFVMDYIEIHFNGPLIRILTNPTIETKEEKYQFPGEGSRDNLCSFIGKKVNSVIFQDGGAFLTIPDSVTLIIKIIIDFVSNLSENIHDFMSKIIFIF
ncbi:MAG: hypothetical protein KKE12_00280 [Proteobacteria bacterium]|nr:hypothetical protein [Pseudomonadota bacterium]